MTVQVITAPACEPISLTVAKAWARIDSTDDDVAQDAVLTSVIGALRRYAENLTGRAFIRRQLRLILPCWHWKIELPQPPLAWVSSVQYLDQDGTRQTLAADQYTVHDWAEPAFIVPAWQVVWPTARAVPDAIWVNYYAGYPESGSPTDDSTLRANVPHNLNLWLMARFATYNELREQVMAANQVVVPHKLCDGLLDDLVIGSRVV